MLRATDDTNVWVSGIQWPHGGGIPAQGRTKPGVVALTGKRGALDDTTPQGIHASSLYDRTAGWISSSGTRLISI